MLKDDRDELRREVEALRAELEESREVLRAIHAGEVDALMVSGPQGDRVYTLQGAEQPYRILVEKMREGAVTLLADGTIDYANQAFAEMAGAPLQKVIGSSLLSYAAETDRSLLKSLLHQSVNRGGSRGELSLLTTTQALVPVHMTMSVLPHDGLHTICAVVTNLSDQKRSERILASERFARAILNQAADAITVCDVNARITYANPAARSLAGLDPMGTELGVAQDVWGKAYEFDGTPIPIEDWPLPMALRGQPNSREGSMVRPDGSVYDIQITGVPLRDARGAVVGAVATFRDITERKAAEQALLAAKESAEQAKAAAEQASRAKDRFMAVLSHELRTPLMPVLAAVSLLQKAPHHVNREILELVRRNVEMEAHLIDDLLDLARVAQGRIELNRRPVLLQEVIQRALEVCQPEIGARQLDLAVECGTEPYMVDADAARLQQVFWNLLSNAAKFTAPGGNVLVRCYPDGDHVLVEVQDTGIGIEPDAMACIFDAFAQADNRISRQFGGLGLGLAISKSLVELHGGSMAAASPGKGKGSTFKVRLPLVAEPAAAESSIEVAGKPGEGKARQLNLLLVEDHEDTAELLELVLQSEGHTVRRAANLAEAVRMAERAEFDLLISDLGLPDGSGVDLLRSLRKRGQTLPAIALSGYGQDQDIQRTREAGFAAHLVKPIDVEQLTAVLEKIVIPSKAG